METKGLSLSEEEIKKISQSARFSYHKITGDYQGAEDCAQSVLASWMSKRGPVKQTVKQAVIDYLRSFDGRKSHDKYETRRALNLPGGQGDLDSVGYESDECGRDADRLARFLPQTERVIFLLYTKWGLNGVEIADLFRVSESRIHQRIEGIQSRLSKRVKAEESRAKGKGKEKVEAILSVKKSHRPGMECQESEAMEGVEPGEVASYSPKSIEEWGSF